MLPYLSRSCLARLLAERLHYRKIKGRYAQYFYIIFVHSYTAHIYCVLFLILMRGLAPPPPCSIVIRSPPSVCQRQCSLCIVYMIADFGQLKHAHNHHTPMCNVYMSQLCIVNSRQCPIARPHACYPLHHQVTSSHLGGQLAGCGRAGDS